MSYKITLLVENFPPSEEISSRRWGLLSRELSDLGHTISVITFSKPGTVCIIANGISPSPSAHPIGHSRDAETRNIKLIHHFGTIIKLCKPRVLDSSVWKWLKLLLNSRVKSEIKNSDIIISSYGPAGPLLLGTILKLLYKVPHIVDLRDCFDSKHQSSRFIQKINQKIESSILRSATARITIGVVLSRYLSQQYKAPFVAIYNGMDDYMVSSVRPNLNPIEFYYAGTIYQHRIAAFKLLIDIIEEVEYSKLTVRLIGNNKAEIETIVRDSMCSDRVEILPSAPQEVVSQEMLSGKLPVVLENLSDNQAEWIYGNVTGKFFELVSIFSEGVVIASYKSELNSLCSEIDGWHCINTKDQFKFVMGELLELEPHMEENLLKKFNMTSQAKKLNQLIYSVSIGN